MTHHTTITARITQKAVQGKRVLLRADLNVPLDNGIIIDTYRLEKIQPTIDTIIQLGGTVILTTHIGRPKKKEPHLSTQIIIPWFIQQGYDIVHAPDIQSAHTHSLSKKRCIILLENLRFFPGEKTADPLFAQQLAQLGDFYINDAFGLLHRTDTSITLVPRLFTPENRSIGLLVQEELEILNTLLYQPKKPVMLIIGGGKVSDKLPLLSSLLDTVDMILLCPAIVFSFLYAQKQPIGKSLVDTKITELCHNFLKDAQEKKVTVIIPTDYQIAHENFHGTLRWCTASEFPDTGVGISIGPDTLFRAKTAIQQAGTIFYNGLMGDLTRPETLESVQEIFRAMAESPGMSIIAGGESTAAARQFNLQQEIGHLSTGGGTTVSYLSKKELPGLIPFKKQDKN